MSYSPDRLYAFRRVIESAFYQSRARFSLKSLVMVVMDFFGVEEAEAFEILSEDMTELLMPTWDAFQVGGDVVFVQYWP